jgi:hypothetical protein
MKKIRITLFFLASVVTAQSAVFVVDSFTEGPFDLSSEDDTGSGSAISSPFGLIRSTNLGSRRAAEGTIVTSTLNRRGSSVVTNFDGPNRLPGFPLTFGLSYSLGGPYSLLGSNAFELDFGRVSGVGSLIVELGGSSETFGADIFRNTIDRGSSRGTLTVPFSDLNFLEGNTLGSFDELSFTFESVSEQFFFELNEIRVVPEPSSFLLIIMAGAFGLTRRTRSAIFVSAS